MTDVAPLSGPTRVEARRATTVRAILDAAWELAATSGLEALSLREIAERVGMRAPSLYSYFPSKSAILDALFADGYRQLDAAMAEAHASLPDRASARQRLVALLRAWLAFCQVDAARYRLLFTMAVPGWHPSEEAYAVSVAYFERFVGYVALAGVTDQDDIDLCTALSAGLISQQMANEPEGDRWSRRVEDVIDMFLLYSASRRRRETRRNSRSS